MTIKTTAWHYKMYRWWRDTLDREHLPRPNLCTYFWTVMLWAPLLWTLVALAAGLGKIGGAMGNAIFAPLVDWGGWGWNGWRKVQLAFVALWVGGMSGGLLYLLVLALIANWSLTLTIGGLIIGGIIGIGVGILVIVLTIVTIGEIMGERPKKEKKYKPAPELREPFRMPPTLALIWGYLMGKKHKVCPFLEFEGEEE